MAWRLPPKQALAQLAATGCMNTSYYADAAVQLQQTLALAYMVEPEYVARTAVYCHERGGMKDMPALLCAVLSVRSGALLERVFPRVVDSTRMLRTFVQIMRSGVVGRRSLGRLPKRLIRQWLRSRDDASLFRGSVGNSPSLADIVKMVHPRPHTPSREALYGYLIDRPVDDTALPEIVKSYETWKESPNKEIPDVPFQMLASMEAGRRVWASVARNAPWQTLRMNLNTFARHGVFKVWGMTDLVARRLRDPESLRRARPFPYQSMIARLEAAKGVPRRVLKALEDVLEASLSGVPRLGRRVRVCVDVSSSMSSSLTGFRRGATSKVRCVDVAALLAAAILRRNPEAEIMPFNHMVIRLACDPRRRILDNAARMARFCEGGTGCSLPLAVLNQRAAMADMVIYLSDNQSWMDDPWQPGKRNTRLMCEWDYFRHRNPDAKLVLIDLQPYMTVQAPDRADILNVAGFSDQVFELLRLFAEDRLDPQHWVGVIEAVQL